MTTKTYEVDIDGKTYEVDAPDANTAWRWANIEHAKASGKTKAPAPFVPSGEKETPSLTDPDMIAGNPAVRFAKGAASPFLGVAQLSGKVQDKLYRAIGLPFQPGEALSDYIARAQRLQDEGRLKVGSEGIDVAEAIGSIFSPAFLKLLKLPVAPSFAGKVGQGAAVGTGAGLSAPVTDPNKDFAGEKAKQGATGAALGGAVPAVVAPASKVAQMIYHGAIEPWAAPAAIKGRAFLEAAGDKADEIIALLRSPQEIVPGSRPTAGQAATPAGRAEFAALQRSAEGVKPSDYIARADEQNAARLAAVRSVGKDKDALEAAKRTRDENAAEAYGPVMSRRVSPESETEIMDAAIRAREASRGAARQDEGRFATTAAQMEVRGDNAVPVPGMPRVPARVTNYPERASEAQAASQDARTIAMQRYQEAKYLESATELLKETVGLSDRSLRPLLSRPSMQEALKAALRSAEETGSYFPRAAGEKFSVQNLQRMKEALDDAVRDPATFGIKATEAREIGQTRNAFVKWLSDRVPEWRDARLQYTADSRPVNQMEVGQYLERKLVPALSEEAKQSSASFATALREAPQTIKKATGQPRFQELTEVLTPDQVRVLEGVRDDLARNARFDMLAQKGAKASPNAIDLASESMRREAGGRIPNVLERGVMVTNAIIERLQGHIDRKLAAEIAAEMLNPSVVGDSLAKAKARAVFNARVAHDIDQSLRASTAGGIHQDQKTRGQKW